MTFAACRSAPPARSCGSRRIFPPCRESSAPARPIECGSRYLPPAKDRWLLGRESETPAPPRYAPAPHYAPIYRRTNQWPEIDRDSGVQGKSVSERVILGGRRIIQKKNTTTKK